MGLRTVFLLLNAMGTEAAKAFFSSSFEKRKNRKDTEQVGVLHYRKRVEKIEFVFPMGEIGSAAGTVQKT